MDSLSDEDTVALPAVVFEPNSVSGVTTETTSAHSVVLSAYHAAQTCKQALGAVDMDAVEEAVGFRVVDPLKIESVRQLVPMRRLIGHDRRANSDTRPGEADAFLLAHEDLGEGTAVALTQGNDATARVRAIGLKASIDSIGSGVGGPDMAADISAVDLDSRFQGEAVRLARVLPEVCAPRRTLSCRIGLHTARAEGLIPPLRRWR